MSADLVGPRMPAQITLADLALMAGQDEHHHYEMSPEGVVYIIPPGDLDHATTVSKLLEWFFRSGYTAKSLLAHCAVEIIGGARVPDITVWEPNAQREVLPSGYVKPAGLRLAIEVVADTTREIDYTIKKREYARAGIPNYWIVERDLSKTVRRFTLSPTTGEYHTRPLQPLVWWLSREPEIET